MSFLSKWKMVLFGSSTVITFVTSKIRKLAIYNNCTFEKNDTFNEILFYGGADENQRKEIGLNNLFCVYYVLVHARKSIDICVPNLKSDTIISCLIKMKQINKINIRLALYANDQDTSQDLRKYGIQVKLIKSEVQIEHEFILVDSSEKDGLAIIGSLDYEVNHVNCNRDNTLLTSESAVVITLKHEFDRIWSSVVETEE